MIIYTVYCTIHTHEQKKVVYTNDPPVYNVLYSYICILGVGLRSGNRFSGISSSLFHSQVTRCHNLGTVNNVVSTL